QSHDPAYDRAQARARRAPHLQRLLVLGSTVLLRPLERSAGCHSGDPPGLGSEQAGAAGVVGGRRLLTLSRLEQTGPGIDAVVVRFMSRRHLSSPVLSSMVREVSFSAIPGPTALRPH